MTEAQSNNDLQGALLHFAVEELVRHQREEFQPLWTGKLGQVLICSWRTVGAGVQQQGSSFCPCLGPCVDRSLTALFLSANSDLDLKVMADPAEQMLMMPLDPAQPLAAGDVVPGQVKLTELVLAEPSSCTTGCLGGDSLA